MEAETAAAPRDDVLRRRAWSLAWPALLASKLLGLGAIVVFSGISTGVWLDAGDIGHRLHGWDAQSYIDIATNGYPPGHVDYRDAFLPGYPLLMALLTFIVRAPVIAGVLVNVAGEALALYYVARLVLDVRDEDDADLAVWLVALAPLGVFLSIVYTESVFIAAAAACLFHAHRGDHGRACLAAAVACATRITGLALLPVLAWEWWRNGRREPLESAGMLAMTLLPLVAYCVYMQQHTGSLLAFHDAQVSPSFRHDVAPPWTGFSVTWSTFLGSTGENRTIWLREIVFGLLGLVGWIACWIDRRLPRSFALYCTLIWLVSTSLSFWLSVPRYLLAMFPITLLFADATRRVKWLRPVLILASAFLMTWGAVIYATGHWLA